MSENILSEILDKGDIKTSNELCFINGIPMDLNKVEKMGYSSFCMLSQNAMPSKLYKYFPNRLASNNNADGLQTVNYSIQSLKDNTVFMQSPSLFDDVYDSDITLNWEEYERARLFEYCKRCKLNVSKSMSAQELGNSFLQAVYKKVSSTGNFDSVFEYTPASEIERLSNENFFLKLQNNLFKTHDWGLALYHTLSSNYITYSKYLQNTFRATCFATTPYSQLMWGGSYADCRRGFCVEYTIIPNNPNYYEVLHNLFPMIYCKSRPDMTERLASFEDKEPSEELLWDIYFHGALRKSIDWKYQNEWRLLLPMKENLSSNDYCIQFFPITKVFLGNRMSTTARKEIIEICHEKNIPYAGITRNPYFFEMQECNIKCEDCQKYINDISNQSK